jgi:hypothetical protein
MPEVTSSTCPKCGAPQRGIAFCANKPCGLGLSAYDDIPNAAREPSKYAEWERNHAHPK